MKAIAHEPVVDDCDPWTPEALADLAALAAEMNALSARIEDEREESWPIIKQLLRETFKPEQPS